MKGKFDQPGLFFSDVITSNGKYLADKPAVICGDEQLSWRELDLRTNRVANALLAMGLRKGDKVCLVMDSKIPMFELLWGIVKAGCVVVPLNVMMARDSLARMINASDSRVLFADSTTLNEVNAVVSQLTGLISPGLFCAGSPPGWHDPEPLFAAASDRAPGVAMDMNDSMSIIFSSGSTGVPKGIEQTHFARHYMFTIAIGPGIRVERSTICLCTTPLYSNGTWITMLPTVFWGGTIVLAKFSPTAFLEQVQRHKVTHSFMVPSQYMLIVEAPDFEKYDLGSLKALVHAGQAMNSATYHALRRRIPHAGVFEIYGNTEGVLTISPPGDKELPGKLITVGKPGPGEDIVILDEDGKVLPQGEMGEITGRSSALMKGYYNDPERTEEAIWRDSAGRTYLRTGDIGRFDEDGYLYVLGRIKDMIKSGGINIFSSDLEEVFMKHPDVMEVAVIGIPHEKWAETPMLLAIRKPGAVVTEGELMEWGNQQLGKFQRVTRVEFRTEFPRAALNKVLKRELRKPYWEGLELGV